MNSTAGSGPVREYLSARVREGWMPGASWWIEGPRGPINRGAIGAAAIEPARVGLDERTPFDLASLTKPLCTALLLVWLEQEGRIDPHQPLTTWFRGLQGSALGKADLIDLASHVAGLPSWRPLYLSSTDSEGYVKQIAREAAAVPAGETVYSDLGYILLGLALERATDQELGRLFDEQIAARLGNPRIGFAKGDFPDAAATERGNDYERRMAGAAGETHAWRTEVLRGQVHDANAWGLGGVAGHAGLFGTAEAVATVAREILRPEKLGLGRVARERLLEIRQGTEGRTVGFVAAASSGAARGVLPPTAPGHTGFTGTSLWLVPRAELLVILLTNRVHPRVERRDFQRLRRGFHRLAIRVARSADPDLPLE